MANKILCGLDIGTNSVGWCVTDENNQVIQKQGKSLWGVRMFDEAESCKERRAYRTNRRRLKRRKERLTLLQGLFANEMQKVDSSFFMRLNESSYHESDRSNSFKYTLFNDFHYTDKQYFKDYPTIYHLRKKLLKMDEKADLRFIYLALHHMVKYRGNFLLEGTEDYHPMQKEEADQSFRKLKEILQEILFDNDEGIEMHYDENSFNQLKEINKNFHRITELKEQFNGVLNLKKEAYLKKVIIPLMVGATINLKDIGSFIEVENFEFKKICVSEEQFDEHVGALTSSYPEQENIFNAMIICKKIYQFFLLGKLLGDHKYLSDAMVEKYEKHKKDLAELKKYMKANHPESYSRLFRKPKKVASKNDKEKKEDEDNYSRYIGSYATNGEIVRFAHGSQEGFYKLLKEILQLSSSEPSDSYLKQVKKEIDDQTFLPLLNSKNNSVFPYQLNLAEMKVILEKQAKFYPFLLEKDEDGSIMDKMLSLLTFKIPYYVGPLAFQNESNREHVWIVRKEGKIYPWNFDRMVDKEQSAAEFILRMLNKCSYLPSCYCLPTNSIIFSYYQVLSFVNKLLVNGSPLKYEDKMDLIHHVFIGMRKRKVSIRDMKSYFISKHGREVSITFAKGGEMDAIPCNMSSYLDFANIFGEEYVKEHIDVIEDIIRDIVLFEDKRILANRLEKEYLLDKDTIQKIKALNYSKYGRLSKELLMKLISCDENGEVYGSVIQIMERTNENLQQILTNEKYRFDQLIKQYNKEHQTNQQESVADYVQSLYVSPGMKRPLLQAYAIIEEIEKILGRPIDEYYVECTRSNENEKKKTKTRKEKLMELYQEATSFMKEDMHFQKMQQRLKETDESHFQSDKYYLYFLQLGRCMYSGDVIDLESLFYPQLYDIDHIIPQSMIKDDSFRNRVLVKQECNKTKSDQYPIPQSLFFHGKKDEAFAFYKKLKDIGFMDEDKLTRLTRRELTNEDYTAFVNRQLVFTNQAVKGLISVIQNFKDTATHHPRIIYSKAENVSYFRNKFDLIKSRTANNFHHAHDAYLNIVVGRAIDAHFSPFHQNEKTIDEMHKLGLTTNPMNIFKTKDDKNPRIIYDRSKNIAWNPKDSLQKVIHQIYNCFDILTTTRAYYGTTLFGKVTIYKAGDGNIAVKQNGPLSDAKKYGGFKQYGFGSYALICFKNDFIIEAIPTLYMNDVKTYLVNNGYPECEIVIPKLKINSVIEIDGKRFCITGKTGNRFVIMNLLERIFSRSQLVTIKKLDKLKDRLAKQKDLKITGEESSEDIESLGLTLRDGKNLVISPAMNERTKEIVLTTDECNQLYQDLIEMYQKKIYSYSASAGIVSHMEKESSTFAGLSILGKHYVLCELLKFLKCNERTSVDLSIIKGKKQMGVMSILNKLAKGKLIAESVTGYYRKVIKVIE